MATRLSDAQMKILRRMAAGEGLHQNRWYRYYTIGAGAEPVRRQTVEILASQHLIDHAPIGYKDASVNYRITDAGRAAVAAKGG